MRSEKQRGKGSLLSNNVYYILFRSVYSVNILLHFFHLWVRRVV